MAEQKTLSDVCVGKTIANIHATPRGLYEGAYVSIKFTDGTVVDITDNITLRYVKECEEMISFE